MRCRHLLLAAKDAGVKHIVLVSPPPVAPPVPIFGPRGAPPPGKPDPFAAAVARAGKAEAAVRRAGIPFTIIRPVRPEYPVRVLESTLCEY